MFTDDGALGRGAPGAPLRRARRRSTARPTRRGGRDRRQLPRPAAGPRVRRHRRRTVDARAPCDDGPFGKGTGGELTYTRHAAGRRLARRVWLAVAGSDQGLADAQTELAGALREPGRRAGRQGRLARSALAQHTQRLAARRPAAAERGRLGQAEPRRPHADARRTCRSAGPTRASSTRRRSGTVAARDVDRRRLPRLPVDLRHRRRVHGVRRGRGRAVPDDRGPPARAARRLRHPQQPLGRRRRTRWSPTARSSSATTRQTTERRRHQDQRLQHRRDGQVPERGRAGVALDRRQRASATRCTTSPSATCTYVDEQARRRPRRLARGLGQRRAHRAWARRSSTTRVYYIRGLYDLADMAQRQARQRHRDVGDATWPTSCAAQFEQHVVGPGGVAVRRLARRPGQHPGRSRSTGSARCRWRPSCTSAATHGAPGWPPSTTATTALAGARERLLQRHRARSTSACSTPAAAAAPTARATSRSSR